MAKEYVAAYKEGNRFVTFGGQDVQNLARGEIDFADAHEEYIDARINAHAKPVMLVREHGGRAWRQMSAGDMRRAAQ